MSVVTEIGWVFVYVAIFGLSDRYVRCVKNPLIYYFCMLFIGAAIVAFESERRKKRRIDS